ncbi:Spy0128 family protein [uncultured Ruminococcus sp.]|uniref:Spy0128 family protein n=1 Tax=uncultured Ruminococcus sp. TaxID=165186 RepID=UPI0026007447|nr:FctA domain-containing protein [uncultured Ruminococcus sp.]
MQKTTHRLEYRVLAGLLSLVCLFSLLVGTAPGVFAAPAEYPENIELLFLNTPDENTIISADAKTVDYTIPDSSQQVDIRLRISLNKKYEDGQLMIEIPYNGFRDRDGGDFHMANKAAFLNQINTDTSLLRLYEDRSKGSGDAGVIVLTNKTASAPQIELDISYNVTAATVRDNGAQDYGIKITDTKTGEDRSPDKITATFRTHVRNAKLYKYTEDYGIDAGCYYAWDDMLEERYKLTSKYGIDEAAFTELCREYDYVGYRLKCSVDHNQSVQMYLKDEPEGGEVVAMSRLFTYKDCYPLDKVTEGEHAGEWFYDGSDAQFLCLVRYPKSVAESASGDSNPYLNNKATVTYVGVDGDADDVTSDSDTCRSVWQGMGAFYHGDIWSVKKESNPDPSGALDLLRAGKDATFAYTITGIGKTYKYGAADGYTYKNGPYWMEVVDDALYVNGLGEEGKDSARLTPDDFHFKTFTMKVLHKDVTSVKLNMDVNNYTYRPIADRKPVEVYVMTADKPDVWQLDQKVALPSGSSNYDYADEDGNEIFDFKHDKVYRIKFTYREANGDIELVSKVTGVLKGSGTTVKQVLANMDAINLENFQLFNWDAQMGYDGQGRWENPNDGSTIYSSDPWVKQDLMAFDAANYEGHANEEGNIKIATRLSARNKLIGADAMCGAAKVSGGIKQEDQRIYGSYTLAAMSGMAATPDELAELIGLGVVKGSKQVVFHELLPVGMSLESVEPVVGNTTYFSDNPKQYNWDKIWSQYSGHIHPVSVAEPEVAYEVTDNYKGTFRQMAKITVTYPELPIVKLGEHSDIAYALASVIKVKTRGEYADLRSSKLDNYMVAQFIDDKGEPIPLEGTMSRPDDGSVYAEITDRDGKAALSDVDEDGDTETTSIVAADCTDTVVMYYSGTQLKKKIKADDYDTYFKDFTQTYAGHNYTYRIQFFTNVGTAKNVVIFDSIEEAYNESKYQGLPYWKGRLYGVDLKEARDAGFDGIKVYVNTTHFCTDEEIATNYATGYAGLTPDELTADNGWQEVDPDSYKGWADVKTIAFSIGENVTFGQADELPKSVCVYLKMTAPDTIHPDQTPTEQVLAYNAPAYYCEKKMGLSGWAKDTTIANVVTIGLKSATADIPAISKKITGAELPADFEDTCTFSIKPVKGSQTPRAYKDGVWGKEISAVNVRVNADNASAIADENGSMLFTEPCTQSYEITEKAGKTEGVVYSKEKYLVTYDVTDERKDVQYDDNTLLDVKQHIYKTADADGTALETPVEVEKIVFENKYEPAPAEFEIPAVIKKINGAERPEEKEFTFGILNTYVGVIIPMPEKPIVTIKGEGKASFGKVLYTGAGKYRYIIKEIAAGQKGYTYDGHGYLLTVNVTDVGGKLKAEVSELTRSDPETEEKETAKEIVFENTYTPNPSSAVAFPEVYKQFSGQTRLDDKEFNFTLSAKNGAPLPENTTVTVAGAGKAAFGEVSYDKAGKYVYEITEDDFDLSYIGYTKDNTVYTYTVTVVDNDGQLDAEGVLTKSGDEANAAVFVNDYTPIPTSIVTGAPVKKIDGDTHGNEPKVFAFEMTPADGAPAPASTVSRVQGEGMGRSFGRITFTEAGTYSYTISEKALPDDYTGFTKDNTVYDYTVTVTDNGGRLTAKGVLTLNGERTDELVFTNTYKPEATYIDLPMAVKTVEGDIGENEDKVFTFELISAEENADTVLPMPENTTATVTGSGEATPFGTIKYDDAGIYHYSIIERELDETHTGYTRDESVYALTITVNDNGGKLSASYVLTKDGEQFDNAEFVNEYKPLPAELELPAAVKEIDGDTADSEDREFTFVLTDAEDASSADQPMPEPNTAKATGAGEATPFGKIKFTEAGEYSYEIFEQELDDTHAGYTRDGSVYRVDVTVTDKDGQLTASYVMTKNGEPAEKPVFVNNYKAEPCDLELPVAVKEIDGTVPDEEEREFTFELTSAEDETAPMPEKAVAAVKGEGEAEAFGKVTYDKAGTYTYEIFERDLDDSYVGYSKDNSVYTLTVTVNDIGGKLAAKYTLTKNGESSDALIFVNKYSPKTASAELEIKKQIEGTAPAEAETYSFIITGGEGAETTITITGAGKFTFGGWTYTEAGVYSYTVSEVKGNADNCDYDNTVYTVTDTVTDKGGILVISRNVTVNGAEVSDITFVNTYSDDSEVTSPEDESSETGSPEESSRIPEGDDSKEQTTSEDSSTSDSSAADSSSSSADTASSKPSDSSKTESKSTAASTNTNDSNPKTGASKTLAGIEIVLLGAAICVLKKRKNNK